MDDIYFSDKNKKSKKGKDQQRERISADKTSSKKENIVSGKEAKPSSKKDDGKKTYMPFITFAAFGAHEPFSTNATRRFW